MHTAVVVRYSSIIIDRGCGCIEHDARADSIHCQCFHVEMYVVKAYSGSGVVLFAGRTESFAGTKECSPRKSGTAKPWVSLLVPTGTQD